MRAFIVLCLVALASADKLGYNYHPVGHSDNGLSFQPGSGSIGGAGGPSGGIGGGPAGGFGGGPSGGFGVGPSGDDGGDGPGFGGAGGAGGAPGDVEFQKEYFTYVANDDEFDEPASNDQIANSLKKNLRVIFIKGPEGRGLENAVVNLAKQAADQRTAIYVLQKHTDLGDLANKLQAAHDVQRSKPEVHFVKYRTPEDAANAQHAIQAQYDQLGGNSQSHDGGVAPVHNFASPAAPHHGGGHGGGSLGGPSGGSVAGPSSTYLPASILRRLRL